MTQTNGLGTPIGVYPQDFSSYKADSTKDAYAELGGKLSNCSIHDVARGLTSGINKNEMADLRKSIDKYKSSSNPEVVEYALKMERHLAKLEEAQKNPTEFHKDDMASKEESYAEAAKAAGVGSAFSRFVDWCTGRQPTQSDIERFKYIEKERKVQNDNVIDYAVMLQGGDWMDK